MSDTAAAGVAHRSMTAVNEIGSDIESLLGQSGPFSKANMADDTPDIVGEVPAMAERISETEQKIAFIKRVRLARKARFKTQDPICTILGIDQGTYKHYEKRSALPYRFIPKFVAATGIDYEWLLTGEGKGPAVEEPPKEKHGRAARQQRGKAA